MWQLGFNFISFMLIKGVLPMSVARFFKGKARFKAYIVVVSLIIREITMSIMI